MSPPLSELALLSASGPTARFMLNLGWLTLAWQTNDYAPYVGSRVIKRF